MKLNFTRDIRECEQGIKILSKRLSYSLDESGLEVVTEKRKGNIEVRRKENTAYIKYEKKIHFFRALGILLENCEREFHISETPQFQSNGVMIDASRNAVMKVEAIKDFIEIMAVMGLNLIMMYTEDTYEVKEYPYFGYMRGRYTEDELRECDLYAEIFGIEMVPCIQTLAHMSKALKWNHGINIRDTNDILLADSEDTYQLIETLMMAASKPFRSNRIHLGMDEAADLGLGRYRWSHGFRKRSDIIREHFEQVRKITNRLGLDAMIWSDMYFKSNSSAGYYDTEIKFPKEVIDSVPRNFSLVYWDYEHTDADVYRKMIQNHRQLTQWVIFAGGIHTWGSMTVNYRETLKTTVPALYACIENNISEVFATIWGDNGNQVNVYEALYGMQLYAEIGYGHQVEHAYLNKRFKACTGEDGAAFLTLDMLDDFGQENTAANPSEYLLWQDILTGMFDKHIGSLDVRRHYGQVKAVMKENMDASKVCKGIFEYSYRLADVLETKADIGVRIKAAYDANNSDALREIADIILPELTEKTESFKKVYRALWLSTYKAFGFEVIDMRIGTLLSRIETARFRLKQYLAGEISIIEELEEERLFYHIDDWQRSTFTDLNIRTESYLKYVNAASCSNGFYD